MNECINLAVKGIGKVSPNPLVGSVIVRNNRIIGKGYHKEFGKEHAEVIAVRDAKRHVHSLKGASLYVNLEPCCHTGKTPPCADLIIKEGITAVFVGTKDLNPLVNGKGLRKLKNAGIKVTEGVLRDNCRELNKAFFYASLHKRPFVTLKFAQSIDGFIALNNFKSKWITDINTRKIAHNIRAFHDAVLIGSNTLRKDNPHLDCRLSQKSIKPDVILLVGKTNLDFNARLFKIPDRNVFIYSPYAMDIQGKNNLHLKVIKPFNGRISLKKILNDIFKKGINSILVEGGSYTLSQFFEQNIFEEIYVMTAPKIFGKGISPFANLRIGSIQNRYNLILQDFFSSGNDIITNYKNYR